MFLLNVLQKLFFKIGYQMGLWVFWILINTKSLVEGFITKLDHATVLLYCLSNRLTIHNIFFLHILFLAFPFLL